MRNTSKNFEVDYGYASVNIEVGNTVISTTKAAYHGMSVIGGGTTPATITVYDSINTATGSIIDKIVVGSGVSTNVNRYIPTMAKYGMYAVMSGTGAQASLFYGPRG